MGKGIVPLLIMFVKWAKIKYSLCKPLMHSCGKEPHKILLTSTNTVFVNCRLQTPGDVIWRKVKIWCTHTHTHTHTHVLPERVTKCVNSWSVCCTFDNLSKFAQNLYLFILQSNGRQLMLSLFDMLPDNLTYTTVQQVSLYSERQALTSFIIYSLVAIYSEERTC